MLAWKCKEMQSPSIISQNILRLSTNNFWLNQEKAPVYHFLIQIKFITNKLQTALPIIWKYPNSKNTPFLWFSTLYSAIPWNFMALIKHFSTELLGKSLNLLAVLRIWSISSIWKHLEHLRAVWAISLEAQSSFQAFQSNDSEEKEKDIKTQFSTSQTHIKSTIQIIK